MKKLALLCLLIASPAVAQQLYVQIFQREAAARAISEGHAAIWLKGAELKDGYLECPQGSYMKVEAFAVGMQLNRSRIEVSCLPDNKQ